MLRVRYLLDQHFKYIAQPVVGSFSRSTAGGRQRLPSQHSQCADETMLVWSQLPAMAVAGAWGSVEPAAWLLGDNRSK